MKISFITTVFNEEDSIKDLLESLEFQSKKPYEIIIVDGGSCDRTVAKIKNESSRLRSDDNKLVFKILIKTGNRAVGRNEAIRNATGDVIICSDAGCTLDNNWAKNITEPFKDPKVDVVAGYYKGDARTVFQKCLVPYVLVMEDRVDPKNFLPASRSMAFRKSIWEKIGGLPEKFSHNEDYVFAKRLKKIGAKIIFKKDAVVYWNPRRNLKDAFVMFFRFALGDSEARIFRPKVLLLFIRYIFGIMLLMIFFIFKLYFILNTLYLILFLYFLWAISKNYRYVKNWRAFLLLPLFQATSDIGVISGTTLGLLRNLWDTQRTQ